ncbi:MAG: efflux transporter outer membrane subunit [Magnetococcales bacterium]|nr:efflux transporter outer membrane subunit [Magnetococcales bacterium]
MPVSFKRLPMLLLLGTLGVVGCTIPGPDDHRPETRPPDEAWQAALPHDGSVENLNNWWGRFQDPALTALIDATLNHHPGLDGALAAIEVARAALTTQQAADLPHGDASGKVSRSGNRLNPTVLSMTTTGMAVDASWELDLFGRVQRATEGARAKVTARQAEWHGLRVTLAAEVATLYNELRGCERLRESLTDEITSRRNSLEITRSAIQAGLVAPSEGELALAGLADARAQLTGQQGSCDLAVKGLVALSGMGEAALRQLLLNGTGKMAQVAPFAVTTLPAQLLAQRPDLASAESELVAADAEIGVARANRFPRFSLLGSVGAAVNTLGGLSQNNQPWSFGPALLLPMFDGGVREATVRAAHARRQAALANYRQAVQNAVREVESALVNLASSRQRVRDTRLAARGFAAYFAASEENWRKGGISLLALEEARRKSIGAERAVLQLERQEVQHWINLYKSLGGGWSQGATS